MRFLRGHSFNTAIYSYYYSVVKTWSKCGHYGGSYIVSRNAATAFDARRGFPIAITLKVRRSPSKVGNFLVVSKYPIISRAYFLRLGLPAP